MQPYLLRDLAIERTHQVWGIDITYVPLKKGFLYRFVTIDWFSRRIVDYGISYSFEKKVFAALSQAQPVPKKALNLEFEDYCRVKVSMDGNWTMQGLERFFRNLK